MNTETELKKALELHAKGYGKDALVIYERILEHEPCHADAWHLKGLLAFAEKRFEDSEMMIRTAMKYNPDCVLYHMNLGHVLSGAGYHEKALDEYLHALEIDSGNHEAVYRVALMFQSLGEKEKAFSYYEQGLRINPYHALTWNNLGNLAMDYVQPDDALMFFNKAIALDPDFAEAYNNKGCLMLKLNRVSDAMPLFGKALSIRPDFHEALNNLGNAYKKRGEWDLAIPCLEKSFAIEPRSAEVAYNLAEVLNRVGQGDNALDYFIEATRLKSDYIQAYQQIVTILNGRCDWEACRPYQNRLRGLSEKVMAEKSGYPEAPFNCIGRYPDEGYARSVTASWSRNLEEFARKLGLVFSFEGRKDKDGPVTLGYLSNNVKNHPNAHLVSGIFKRHDRRNFKVNFYSYGENDGSIYRKKIEQDVDHFADIKELSYVDAARKIYSDDVDILIDLTGYTLGSLMEIPALRPAPIQVRYLGFPASMQASFFDYFITDRIMTPLSEQDNYSEKFVYMPHCYQVNDGGQAIATTAYTRKDFNLPESAFVFCSFNAAYKIESVMFSVWMEILKAVEEGVLWLLRENEWMEKNLRAQAARHGVDEKRLVFSGKAPKAEHLARLKLADLALDTRLVSGHITTSDALWAGVPVITKKGDHFISRAPASILTNIGLPELVTESLKAYKELAICLANDKKSLTSIRKKLESNRETTSLFDTGRFVRNFEKGLRAMWEGYRKGRGPEQIVISEEK